MIYIPKLPDLGQQVQKSASFLAVASVSLLSPSPDNAVSFKADVGLLTAGSEKPLLSAVYSVERQRM